MAKKSTAKKSFSNQQLLIGALGAGTLLALMNNSFGATPNKTETQTPDNSPAPAPKPTPTPKAAPTSYTGATKVIKPGQNIPAASNPLITKNTVFPAAQPLVYAFVDSINGEGIYRGIQSTYNVFTGNGVSKIISLNNGQYLGLLTGRNGQGMSEVYHVAGGLEVNFWVATSEIVTMYGTQAQAKIKAIPAASLTPAQVTTIKDFFLKS